MVVATVNQREIAKRLNLSAATVSRSFRNHPDITYETRTRVLEEAKRLGYTLRSYSNGASSAVSPMASLLSIGILIAKPAGPIATHTLSGMMTAGISMAATERGAVPFVQCVPSFNQAEPARAAAMIAQNMQSSRGLILLHHFEPAFVRALAELKPCVTVAHPVLSAGADHVDSDHYHAMSELLDHLIGLGHRKIGFIDRSRQLEITRARFNSFMQSIERRSLPWESSMRLQYSIGVTEDEQRRQIDAIVALIKHGVTAFQCESDGTARRIAHGLTDRGLRIPEDVSIVGYDGIAETSLKLTTARVPFIDLGAAAFHRLLHRIDQPGETPQRILLRCEFVLGGTTGTARPN